MLQILPSLLRNENDALGARPELQELNRQSGRQDAWIPDLCSRCRGRQIMRFGNPPCSLWVSWTESLLSVRENPRYLSGVTGSVSPGVLSTQNFYSGKSNAGVESRVFHFMWWFSWVSVRHQQSSQGVAEDSTPFFISTHFSLIKCLNLWWFCMVLTRHLPVTVWFGCSCVRVDSEWELQNLYTGLIFKN